jgi:hypothetical protein
MSIESNTTNKGTVMGTVSGTALSVIGISSADILKTAVLAATGALVSFSVSVFLKWVSKRLRK